VITVEGRAHPVSTHLLEDVYEKMEYCLALDSPASGAYFAQHGEKVSFTQFSFSVEYISVAALSQLLYLVTMPFFRYILYIL
jgi:hypothetical protein